MGGKSKTAWEDLNKLEPSTFDTSAVDKVKYAVWPLAIQLPMAWI
jgi:hypothetical protein